MKFLVKPNQYSRTMYESMITGEQWKALFEHPPVYNNKDRAPLAIYGTAVAEPELDESTGMPRCTGGNVGQLFALQLDYDSGLTIDQFSTMYKEFRWSLYTSYSYGYKEGDRFRVVVPLAHPLPCRLLRNRRVRKNLLFHFPHVDESALHAGHWQILPCVREQGAPYIHRQNQGTLWGDWGGISYLADYERWVVEDAAAEAMRAEEARRHRKEVDVVQLLIDMEEELRSIPVGSGVRYSEAMRILAKYAHRGLGDALLGVDCPWPGESKWEKRWPGMVDFASRIEA